MFMLHNGYYCKEMDLTSQVQILEKIICVLLCAHALGKGIDSSLFPTPGKIIGFLALVGLLI